MTVLTFLFQVTELSVVLQALGAHEEISDVLSGSNTSATQIIRDAKTIHSVLQRDCETTQEAPASQNHLVNLMRNETQQINNFPAESSDIGPALYAARQVAHWSSVFVSMMSVNNTSTSTIVSTAPVVSSCINTSAPASQALVASTIAQATPATLR